MRRCKLILQIQEVKYIRVHIQHCKHVFLVIENWSGNLIMLSRTVKLNNYNFNNVIRRKLSDGVTFKNIFSQDNLPHLKNRLHDQADKLTISKYFEKLKHVNRKAAVLVPLCIVNDVPSVLLTLRSSQLSQHSGQVSFPGGMKSENDEDLIGTALRETEEEIGLSGNSIDVWGQLPQFPGRNFDVLITPVIGFCGRVQLESLLISQHEVVEVFAPSLESLCIKENVSYTTFDTSEAKYKLPVFLGQKHRVWGLTAVMLHQTLQVLMPELFTHKSKFMF